MPGADLVPQVIEYLVKKGYVKTEQTLRQESSKVDRDGRPMVDRAEDTGTEQYGKAYRLLSDWIKGGLDIYKASIFFHNRDLC
jgi:transcription initiation factor TFIID subunit 5